MLEMFVVYINDVNEIFLMFTFFKSTVKGDF